MTLATDVDLEEHIMSKVKSSSWLKLFQLAHVDSIKHLETCTNSSPPQDDLSGADIKAICTEAGLLALRERRMKVNSSFIIIVIAIVNIAILAFLIILHTTPGYPRGLQEVQGERVVQEARGHPGGPLHVVTFWPEYSGLKQQHFNVSESGWVKT